MWRVCALYGGHDAAQLSRENADVVLRKNGDFLVRENVRTRGQYVLSSMQQVMHSLFTAIIC